MNHYDKKPFILNKEYKKLKMIKNKKVFHIKSKSLGYKKINSSKIIHKKIKENIFKNCIQKFNSKKYQFLVKSNNKSALKLKKKRNTTTLESLDKKNNFNYLMIVGKGGFSKVWIVEHKSSKKLYALKQMSKWKIIKKKSVKSVLNELEILKLVKSNFIVNIENAFQDRDKLYLMLEYLRGGDLRFHLCSRKFNEEEAKFIIACIILGLEEIHSNGFIHRDIKPENLIFEDNGYLRITDFGISRKLSSENSQDTSGTPCYMSPEVLFKKNHGYSTDFYAVGIILYELMNKKRPYNGHSRKEIRDILISKEIKIKLKYKPVNWSIASVLFLNSLLKRNFKERIGHNDFKELKDHIWFKNINWKSLKQKKLKPKFKPDLALIKNYYRYATFNSTANNNNLEDYLKNITEKQLLSLFIKYVY